MFDRIIDVLIDIKLKTNCFVLISGPPSCGKSSIAIKHANSIVNVDKNLASNILLAEFDVGRLLAGKKPLLVENYDLLEGLLCEIKTQCNKSKDEGLFILTTRQIVDDSIKMFPLSLYESEESNGLISLLALYENPDMNISDFSSNLGIKDLIDACCRGGFPKAFVNENFMKRYIENLINLHDDLKDIKKLKSILKVYSRNISTNISNVEILNQVQRDFPTMSKSTFYRYLNALKDLWIVFEIESWNVNLRARSAIKKTSKKEFIDPSISPFILNLNSEMLIYDLETFQKFFENLCIRDLMVYTSFRNGKIYYYEDRYGLSIDCILQLDNEDYALIQFELSRLTFDEAAGKLLKMDKLIERKIGDGEINIKRPKFLAIITSIGFSYVRSDGVKVIPICILR
ncbi:ATP-binding protein [Methanobrevibacter sp.]|uniref:ATP-binding protein n=1 Tax=Methanobrevibacter sp. TaxID=66852 RepID=UPI00388D445C